MDEFLICDEDNLRLDVFLSREEDSYTRSFLSGIISDGKVTVNGKVVTKSGYKLSKGDEVGYEIPEPVSTDIKPVDIPLDIVYEDDDADIMMILS